jgi:hypothetical protein
MTALRKVIDIRTVVISNDERDLSGPFIAVCRASILFALTSFSAKA